MATVALNSAATGLRALSTRLDVIANNLANADTLAFKRSRVNFEDLMYLKLKQPGTTNAAQEQSPAGIFVGLGVKVSNTQIDLVAGSLESTDRQLDLAIAGSGFFKVKLMSTLYNGVGYTRNGNLFVNSEGRLVLGMGDGYELQPPITIPPGVTDISISEDGVVEGVNPDGTKQSVGTITITRFINPQGLALLGGSIYAETEASGTPTDLRPGAEGAGILKQGYLEGSNVDPVKELVTLIKTQRAFELNSQSIQAADNALQVIGNLRRF